MKALSIKQYWLYAITDLDKRIENRGWKPNRDMLGQRIALHASLGMDHFSAENILRISRREVHVVPVPLGKIVATAVIARVVIESHDKWFFGPYGWVFEDVIKLDKPIPARGQLGLWDVPAEILAEIHEQLRLEGE